MKNTNKRRIQRKATKRLTKTGVPEKYIKSKKINQMKEVKYINPDRVKGDYVLIELWWN
jgi:hypothetical protein